MFNIVLPLLFTVAVIYIFVIICENVSRRLKVAEEQPQARLYHFRRMVDEWRSNPARIYYDNYHEQLRNDVDYLIDFWLQLRAENLIPAPVENQTDEVPAPAGEPN